jgi:hypothetical protein
MKPKRKNKLLLLTFICISSLQLVAQDSTQQALTLDLGYYVNNNKTQWLIVNAKTKVGKKFEPVKGAEISLYLTEEAPDNFIGKVITDDNGKAKAFLPVSLKPLWDSSSTHTFLAISKTKKQFEEATTEVSVTKSRISIDTVSDEETKSITVNVTALKNGEWLPAKDVEMKVGIGRIAGGILSAGEDQTYTTDSTGMVTVELNKDSLPGDEKGNLVLVAKVESNDEYGNLQIEKVVPWGIAVKTDNSFFDQRTLWSTRYRTPAWLLFMAYSIVIGVWGTMIYLVWQIVKIKKLSQAVSS